MVKKVVRKPTPQIPVPDFLTIEVNKDAIYHADFCDPHACMVAKAIIDHTAFQDVSVSPDQDGAGIWTIALHFIGQKLAVFKIPAKIGRKIAAWDDINDMDERDRPKALAKFKPFVFVAKRNRKLETAAIEEEFEVYDNLGFRSKLTKDQIEAHRA